MFSDELDALIEIALIENALRDGYPPPTNDLYQRGAIQVVADMLVCSDQLLQARVGTPSQTGTIRAQYGFAVDWNLYTGEARENVTHLSPTDRRFILLQDEVRRLTAELKAAHRASGEEEVIRNLVGQIVEGPRNEPPWTRAPPKREKGKPAAEVPVTIWSDWHLSEVIERSEVNGFNAYNMKIAEERVERLVDTTIKLCRNNHTGVYPGIVVNLLGDFISGGIHPELKATDEEEPIPAALKAIDWLTAALTRIAGEFKQVYVPCAFGNHSRTTPKPEYKRYYKKTFDWLIVQMVARHFTGDKRIHFDIRPSNDVHYRVYNERYLACHGDMLGVRGGDGIIGALGPIARGEVKQSGQSSSLGLGFDVLLLGHWHQRLWLPRAIVNNAFCGFNEYAMKALGAKPDRPTQALWFVHPTQGKTASWDIYVDETKPKTATEWVSWKEAI